MYTFSIRCVYTYVYLPIHLPIHCVDRTYLDSNFFVINARRVRSKGQGLTYSLVLGVKDRPSLRLESGSLGSYNVFQQVW